LVSGAAVAAPTYAQDKRGAGCAATAEIVADAVAMRTDGTSQKATTEALKAGDVEAKYVEAVAPLVDWVFTLPEHQLTDEAASAFNNACLAQLG
jgi:hypothetical protein